MERIYIYKKMSPFTIPSELDVNSIRLNFNRIEQISAMETRSQWPFWVLFCGVAYIRISGAGQDIILIRRLDVFRLRADQSVGQCSIQAFESRGLCLAILSISARSESLWASGRVYMDGSEEVRESSMFMCCLKRLDMAIVSSGTVPSGRGRKA